MSAKKVRESNAFKMRPVRSKTDAQTELLAAWNQGGHLFLHGSAGTGKSFVTMALALQDVNKGINNQLCIIRSTVPTRKEGFLPGTPEEKHEVYKEPYVSICSELYGRGDAYKTLEDKATISFLSTGYLRGITFEDTIILVDEVQNMNFQELDTIITRVGRNSRIVFCGDTMQTDLDSAKDRAGLVQFMKIIKQMPSFTFIEFGLDDIVRSGLVKEYLMKKQHMEVLAA